MEQQPLYRPERVRSLFDEMARTYGLVNLISSFGFARRWREQAVRQLAIPPGAEVGDWMSGQGEIWHLLLKRLGDGGRIQAIDFSAAMCHHARQQRAFRQGRRILLLEQDILENGLPDESLDAIISTFGMKTFSLPQQRRLAEEVARVLRPGGAFSVIEVSVPSAFLLRLLYMFYLKRGIPLIGALFLGNPDNYRQLGVYTERFGNCRHFASFLSDSGLTVSYREHFFGCATSVIGKKPLHRPGESSF